MDILVRIIAIVIGYICGLFQTAYIYGKLNHIDIRDYGSGNAGTTNAMRVLGKKAGVITYIGDMLKAAIAGIIMRLLCAYVFNIQDESFVFLIIIYTGLGVALGHNYPFYMGFKGGKGIAASSGVILATFDWKFMVLGLITFVTVALISKYVSLSSICLMAGFFIEIVIFGAINCFVTDEFILKWFSIPAKGHFVEIIIIAFIFCGLAIWRHHSNIKRLIEGNERKIGEKKEQ